jgi:hypothetical protein
MVAAPHKKKHHNDVNNNSIFLELVAKQLNILDSIVNLTKFT